MRKVNKETSKNVIFGMIITKEEIKYIYIEISVQGLGGREGERERGGEGREERGGKRREFEKRKVKEVGRGKRRREKKNRKCK